MEARGIKPKSPSNASQKEVALFWDYENVPVPKNKGRNFLQALKNFFRLHPPACARIYTHKEALQTDVLEEIRRAGPFRVKWIAGTEQNSADKVMMRSTRDALKARPNLSYLILITGDGDFQEFLSELGTRGRRMFLICGHQNYNYRLFKTTQHVFSSKFLANHPVNWWELPTTGLKFIGL